MPNALKRIMHERGLSALDLASRSGLSIVVIHQLMNAEDSWKPLAANADPIAAALRLPRHDVFPNGIHGDDKPKRKSARTSPGSEVTITYASNRQTEKAPAPQPKQIRRCSSCYMELASSSSDETCEYCQ